MAVVTTLPASIGLPQAVERTIHKALAKEPGDRIATAFDLAAALDMALTNQYDAPTFIETPVPLALEAASSPAKSRQAGSSRPASSCLC